MNDMDAFPTTAALDDQGSTVGTIKLPPVRSKHRLQSTAMALVATLLVVLGISFATAGSSEAATLPGYQWVQACFYNYGANTAWSQDTYEQYWTASGWANVQHFAGTSNGCRSWKVPTGVYARFYVDKVYSTGFTDIVFYSYYTNYVLSNGAGTAASVGENAVYEESIG